MVNEIYISRHGLRLDGEDETYWRYYAKRIHDTPLSRGGIIQAEENGEFLQHQHIDHIFCSPFFRTIQTASIIASKINVHVNIEYGFIEQLATKWFGDRFPDIITQDEAVRIFSNINKSYESIVRPMYPEDNHEAVMVRVKRTMEAICERYKGNVLIVGHGASIHAAKKVLDAELEGFNGNMGAMTKFTNDGGRWKCEFSTTAHLSNISEGCDPQILNEIPEHFRKKNQIIHEQFLLERKAKEYAEGIKGN